MQKLGKLFQAYAEGIFTLILFLFSAGMFMHSFTIVGLSTATDNVGPALLPKLIFGLMTLLSLLLLFDYRVRLRMSGTKEYDVQATKTARTRGLISIGGILVFVLLMDKLGFLLSSMVYLFIEIYLLGPKEKRKPILWGVMIVLFCAAVYYLFRYQVYVKLPKGILG